VTEQDFTNVDVAASARYTTCDKDSVQASYRMLLSWLKSLCEAENDLLQLQNDHVSFSGPHDLKHVQGTAAQFQVSPATSAGAVLVKLPERLGAYNTFLRNYRQSSQVDVHEPDEEAGVQADRVTPSVHMSTEWWRELRSVMNKEPV
jgi:hypothetical protein